MLPIFAFDTADMKLVLIGVISTVAAALIVKMLVWLPRSKAKVLWMEEWHAGECVIENGESKTASFYRILVENIGSGMSKEILILLPKSGCKFKISRHKRISTMGTRTIISTDNSYKRETIGETDHLKIPNFEQHTILSIEYFVIGSYRAHSADSVTFDGYAAERIFSNIPFLRERDVLFNFFKLHGFYLAFMILAIAATIASLILDNKK